MLLGGCFHLYLLVQLNTTDIFGFGNIMPMQFFTWLFWGQAFSLGGYFFLWLWRSMRFAAEKKQDYNTGVADILFYCLLPLPLYLLTFPANALGNFLGLLICLLQGYYVIVSDNDTLLDLPHRLPHRHKYRGSSNPASPIDPACSFLYILNILCMGIFCFFEATRTIPITPFESYMLSAFAAASLLLTIRQEGQALISVYNTRHLNPGLADRHLCVRAAHFLATQIWAFWGDMLCLGMILSLLCYTRQLNHILPLVFIHAILANLLVRRSFPDRHRVWDWLVEHPGQMLVGSFLALIIVGGMILCLGICQTGGAGSISTLDCFYTATSAVCVTGLIVVDTATAFTGVGKTVIAALIQVGGMGIMTISSFFAIMTSRRIGMRGQAAIRKMTGEERNLQTKRLLTIIVVGTLLLEAVGTTSLACFYHAQLSFSWLKSLQYGVFMSISSFCNAGFSLHSDNAVSLAVHPWGLYTIAFLIIAGGLGFGVVSGVLRNFFDHRKLPLGIHEKIVLTSTAILIATGTLLFLFCEADNTLAGLSGAAVFNNAFFQAVTARTAGFNSVDITALTSGGKVLMLVLMFIGAGPGSTGGGVKVTTVSVLLLLVRARFRGENAVVVGRRTLAPKCIEQAITVFLIGLMIVTGGCFALAIAMPGADLEGLVFEVVSAMGTVGLSTGLTSQLTVVGKWVIIAIMFIGRVGALTFLLTLRHKTGGNIEYPYAKVQIG